MKKLFFLLSFIFLFTGCQPEARNGQTEPNQANENTIENNENIMAKAYVLDQFPFELEKVREVLAIEGEVVDKKISEEIFEDYYFSTGEELSIYSGHLSYADMSKKYSSYYSPTLEPIEGDLPETYFDLVEKLEALGLEGLELKGYDKASKEEAIDMIGNDQGLLVKKDGSTVKLDDKIKDIECFSLSKTYDGIPIYENQDQTRLGDFMSMDILAMMDDDGIFFLNLSFIPGPIVEENDIEIIGEEDAIRAVEAYNEADLSAEKDITGVELVLLPERIELIEITKRTSFTYKPAYIVEETFEYTKGEETYQDKEYLIVDGETGQVVE